MGQRLCRQHRRIVEAHKIDLAAMANVEGPRFIIIGNKSMGIAADGIITEINLDVVVITAPDGVHTGDQRNRGPSPWSSGDNQPAHNRGHNLSGLHFGIVSFIP